MNATIHASAFSTFFGKKQACLHSNYLSLDMEDGENCLQTGSVPVFIKSRVEPLDYKLHKDPQCVVADFLCIKSNLVE